MSSKQDAIRKVTASSHSPSMRDQTMTRTTRNTIPAIIRIFYTFASVMMLANVLVAQAVRVDQPIWTVGPNIPVTGGPLPQVLSEYTSTVSVCSHPATLNASGVCTNTITTYTDSTMGTACPPNAQLVQLPGTTCSATSNGNVGFWWAGGTIDYTVSTTYGNFGPYTISSIMNGVVSENQFGGVALPAPKLSAGLGITATGGTVPSNRYVTKVTYVGSAGGQTVGSPLDSFNQYVKTTTGSTSVLIVNSQEAPGGATGFNTYICTGSPCTDNSLFYKQNSTPTALADTFKITTTPVTSGANPPTVNTATSPIQGAFAALAGPGGLIAPSTMGAIGTVGASGDPQVPGQIIVDYRTGSIEDECLPTPMKTVIYGSVLGCASFDLILPTQLNIGQQAQAGFFGIHMNPTPFFGGGNNPANPTAGVALSTVAERGGTRTESQWALLTGVAFTNQLGRSVGHEIDVFNQSGTDGVSGPLGGIGLQMNSLGLNKAFAAIDIFGSGFEYAVDLENTSGGEGLYIGTGYTYGIWNQSASLFYGPTTYIPPDDTFTYFIQGFPSAFRAGTYSFPKWYIANSGIAQFPQLISNAFTSANTNGTVNAVVVYQQGSGYLSAPTVGFSGGGCSVQPTATAFLSGNGVGYVTMVTNGSGCTSAPTVSFTPVSGGTGAAALAQLGASQASSGLLRAAAGDTIAWRNVGNTADVTIFMDNNAGATQSFPAALNFEAGNLAITTIGGSAGTLSVAGVTTLTGGLAANGGISINNSGNKLSADTAGNLTLAGSLTTYGVVQFNSDTAFSRTAAVTLALGSGGGDYSGTLKLSNVTFVGGSTTILTTVSALANGAASSAGTLTNAPAVGNPTKWIKINDAGTTRYIPAW